MRNKPKYSVGHPAYGEWCRNHYKRHTSLKSVYKDLRAREVNARAAKAICATLKDTPYQTVYSACRNYVIEVNKHNG